MHEHDHYDMAPPYIVLRRSRGRIDDMGDQEWFCGHRARVWFQWKKPYPKWEPMHLATHQGLYRFRDRAQAQAYIDLHGDMGPDELIELVLVEISNEGFPERMG